MRLIDADALIEELEGEWWYEDEDVDTAIGLVKHAPTIEPRYLISIDQRELCKDINCEDCPFMQDTCKLLDAYAEPSGDLISRAEVLALINKAMFNTDNREMQDYIFNGLRRDVHNLPSTELPKGDLISRKEAIRAVYLLGKRPKTHEIWDCLDALPSADRQKYNLEIIADIVQQLGHLDSYIADTCDRPKGRWIDREKGTDGFYHNRWECSMCGKRTIEKTSFCPYCGSEMGGES